MTSSAKAQSSRIAFSSTRTDADYEIRIKYDGTQDTPWASGSAHFGSPDWGPGVLPP
jgi:hypothetical protein